MPLMSGPSRTFRPLEDFVKANTDQVALFEKLIDKASKYAAKQDAHQKARVERFLMPYRAFIQAYEAFENKQYKEFERTRGNPQLNDADVSTLLKQYAQAVELMNLQADSFRQLFNHAKKDSVKKLASGVFQRRQLDYIFDLTSISVSPDLQESALIISKIDSGYPHLIQEQTRDLKEEVAEINVNASVGAEKIATFLKEILSERLSVVTAVKELAQLLAIESGKFNHPLAKEYFEDKYGADYTAKMIRNDPLIKIIPILSHRLQAEKAGYQLMKSVEENMIVDFPDNFYEKTPKKVESSLAYLENIFDINKDQADLSSELSYSDDDFASAYEDLSSEEISEDEMLMQRGSAKMGSHLKTPREYEVKINMQDRSTNQVSEEERPAAKPPRSRPRS